MDEKDKIYKKVKSVIRQDRKKSSYIGEDDYVSLVKDRVTINFHLKNPSLDIENVFRTVRRTQKIINDKFDYNLEKIEIDIFDSMDEMRQEGRSRSRYASWIAGIYDGKIRVISEKDDKEPESLYIILTHEIIHLAVDEVSKGLCPYWLNEGLAVFLSQEIPTGYLNELMEAINADSVLPLEALDQPVPNDADENIRQLAYSQVFSITEYFIETYGWDTVKSIISQCVRRPLKIILSDLSLNSYLIEQGWKRWLKQKSA